jgi:hypothetical protein
MKMELKVGSSVGVSCAESQLCIIVEPIKSLFVRFNAKIKAQMSFVIIYLS